MAKITHVIKRSGAVVPFNPERITNAIYRAAVAVGGRDRERALALSNQVVNWLEAAHPEGHMPHIEEIQDVVEKLLIENGHAQVAKAYILYRDERNRRRQEDSRRASQPSHNIPWAKIWRILDWAITHQLHTLEALNERVGRGEFAHIVHESEAAYEDDIAMAAEMISDREADVQVVLITGPSSSGKTTTTKKLEQRLGQSGMKISTLNVDNYFFNLEDHPIDEFGDYDFETPQALELDLINAHLQALISGKTIEVPHYDFKSGRRTGRLTPMKLAEDEILFIDSLHGLFPPMTEGIPDGLIFRLYLEPLLQMKGPDGQYIRWTDLRLIRRMLRDAVHRAYNPQRTLEHWHYVRTSEMRNIVPFQSTADFIINSGMPYEICLYRPRLLERFSAWENMYREDALRTDAFERSARVCRLLEAVIGVEDDSAVPAESVLREFIGGSTILRQ